MEHYKPGYLGKVLPEKKSEIADFMHNKYDGFSKVYDACKAKSDKITDIKPVTPDSNNDKAYAVKVSVTEQNVLESIKKDNTDVTVKINGDVISSE